MPTETGTLDPAYDTSKDVTVSAEPQQTLDVPDPIDEAEPFADFGGEQAVSVAEPEIPTAELRAMLNTTLVSLRDAGWDVRAFVQKHGFSNTGPTTNEDGSENKGGLPEEKVRAVYGEAVEALNEVAQ